MAAAAGCAQCPWRLRYDERPASFLGRLWRWHINFCPGWRGYFTSLTPEEKATIAARYRFSKYQ